jgi:DNA-binding HxlR family transcriptional regulator
MATNEKKKWSVGGPKHTLYVVLALARKPMSFNEIEGDTGIPPSTLSRSLKILLRSGMIKTRALTEEEEGVCRGLWKYELTGDGRTLLLRAMDLDNALRAFWSKLKK